MVIDSRACLKVRERSDRRGKLPAWPSDATAMIRHEIRHILTSFVPQESHIGPLAMFFFVFGYHRPPQNKVGRLLKDDREICSSHDFFPHDFCVGGLSDEPNCRVNSLGNSCDGYLWWNLVGFPTETSYLVTSHIFAAASGTWQELADTNWRPGDAGESSRRYGFV